MSDEGSVGCLVEPLHPVLGTGALGQLGADLLATGGSAAAAATLIEKSGGVVAGFDFLVALDFLNGGEHLSKFSEQMNAIVHY